jgi:CRISPR/Cas system-associated protein Csm6
MRDFSDDEFRDLVKHPLVVSVPHHTQYVERAIRVITQLGASAASDEKREGMALTTYKGREEHSRCETKADFS